jgi:hypothetical protein
MTNSTQLITDLDKLASTDFSAASLSKAAMSHAGGHKNLVLMAATALLQATHLKALLLETQALTDADDPQFALLDSILRTLD